MKSNNDQSATSDTPQKQVLALAEVGRYRKKPVVIEAVQWTGENADALLGFLGDRYFNHGGILKIQTLEGTMESYKGDWIIKGIKGEFYPVKPDIFAATYEPETSASFVPRPDRRLLEALEEINHWCNKRGPDATSLEKTIRDRTAKAMAEYRAGSDR